MGRLNCNFDDLLKNATTIPPTPEPEKPDTVPQRYQDVYPTPPLLSNADGAGQSAADLLTIEYFEAEPDAMPTRVFDQHHILINLKEEPHRVENWRDGEHRDFIFHNNEIVVTPAGVESGWRWHARSRVIVITLDPDKLARFTQLEMGLLLAPEQLDNLPQFTDAETCQAADMMRESLTHAEPGSAVIFECQARIFLVKFLRKYGLEYRREAGAPASLSTEKYRQVLDAVSQRYSQSLTVEDLASVANLSPSHFSYLFRQTTGLTPMQFVTRYRIEQAKKRLRGSDAPLIDIALGCGFSDQSHFSRVFKDLEGIPPAEFRKTRQ